VRHTINNGVLFFEGTPDYAKKSKQLNISLDSTFNGSQNASLEDVKKILAEQCLEAGCNAVVDFQYGQKSSGFFQSLLSKDNVYWYGSGYAAIVNEQ
jgi:hypothetical protein